MKKIISMLVAAVLLCTLLVGCGGGSSDTVSATVKVTIEAEDTKILENVEVSIEGIDGDAPLAIDAIIAALTDNDIEYSIVEFAGSDKIEKIDEYDTDGNKYIWELYLNGDDEPADGRLATVEIEDGNELLLKRNAYESVMTESTEATTTAPEVIETVNDDL